MHDMVADYKITLCITVACVLMKLFVCFTIAIIFRAYPPIGRCALNLNPSPFGGQSGLSFCNRMGRKDLDSGPVGAVQVVASCMLWPVAPGLSAVQQETASR
jgi:hypothetical protein